MLLTLRITKELLERSISERNKGKTLSEVCPVAQAIRIYFPDQIVGHYYIGDGQTILCKLPQQATDFIKKYDSLKNNPASQLALKEFDFTIDVPDAIINKINISELQEILIPSLS